MQPIFAGQAINVPSIPCPRLEYLLRSGHDILLTLQGLRTRLVSDQGANLADVGANAAGHWAANEGIERLKRRGHQVVSLEQDRVLRGIEIHIVGDEEDMAIDDESGQREHAGGLSTAGSVVEERSFEVRRLWIPRGLYVHHPEDAMQRLHHGAVELGEWWQLAEQLLVKGIIRTKLSRDRNRPTFREWMEIDPAQTERYRLRFHAKAENDFPVTPLAFPPRARANDESVIVGASPGVAEPVTGRQPGLNRMRSIETGDPFSDLLVVASHLTDAGQRLRRKLLEAPGMLPGYLETLKMMLGTGPWSVTQFVPWNGLKPVPVDQSLVHMSAVRIAVFLLGSFRLVTPEYRILLGPESGAPGALFLQTFTDWLIEQGGMRESTLQFNASQIFLQRLVTSSWFSDNKLPLELQKRIVRTVLGLAEESGSGEVFNLMVTMLKAAAHYGHLGNLAVQAQAFLDERRLTKPMETAEVLKRIQEIMNSDQEQRLVFIVNSPFLESDEAALGFLNSGHPNVVVLKGPSPLEEEFFSRRTPKALFIKRALVDGIVRRLSRQFRELVFIEDGIIDPTDWPPVALTALQDEIRTLGRNRPSYAAVRRYEDHKFDSLGDGKKFDLSDGFSVYRNFHTMDLVLTKSRWGEQRTVRTYENSPVISSEWKLVRAGDETLQRWGEIIRPAHAVIILGPTHPFATVLKKPSEDQIRLVLDPLNPELMRALEKPNTWKSGSSTAMGSRWEGKHRFFQRWFGMGWVIQGWSALVESYYLSRGIWSIKRFLLEHSGGRYDHALGWIYKGHQDYEAALDDVEAFARAMRGKPFWRHAWEHLLINLPNLARFHSAVRAYGLFFAA